MVRTLVIETARCNIEYNPRLPPNEIGMIVDRGHDFPADTRERLLEYGEAMWMFRDQPHRPTTRALNLYYGEHRECV